MLFTRVYRFLKERGKENWKQLKKKTRKVSTMKLILVAQNYLDSARFSHQ